MGIWLWLGVLAAVYFVLWPGMWVAPGKMLQEVFGNAFSYAFEGARLSAAAASAAVAVPAWHSGCGPVRAVDAVADDARRLDRD